ncbi:MAG: type III secretion protein [Betaproteobacteria bacterium]|jgi:type III secretion protein O|nr:type III secretion protein [Betaproteobacteria bacterium]NBT10008.1 type III secretion protein [Betaproteobacteria bacterium]NBU50072.1 type III secretion protein [Betaproteobacteria bacterium]NBX96948.1 type III secretion protein [Betaproteobacteria bacterium]
MAIVDELLYIKTFRERQAETALHRSRQDLRLAHDMEKRAQEQRDAFAQSAVAQEDRWYRELCSRIVRVRDIDDLHSSIAGLRRTQQELDEEWAARLRQRQQAQDLMKQAGEHYRLAGIARNKFTELARLHHGAVAQEAERREELELEELASVVRERDDWGGGDD